MGDAFSFGSIYQIRRMPMNGRTEQANIDFAAILPVLARAWLGEPTEETKTELRFGARGSLSVDKKKGTWFDFEIGKGAAHSNS